LDEEVHRHDRVDHQEFQPEHRLVPFLLLSSVSYIRSAGTFRRRRLNIHSARQTGDTMIPTDDQLMAAVVAGDREAYGTLYRRRRPDVYRFAVHMTGSASLAEDIAQDVFLAVIRDARRYIPGLSGVVPWLLGIARNFVRRRLAERRMDPLDAQTRGAAVMVAADIAESMQREQEIAALRRALAALSTSYREVVVLCELQEMSYAEASQVIGCAIGTVRSRLHRGRALLARAMRTWREHGTVGPPRRQSLNGTASNAWMRNGAIRRSSR
jgi:RNA polymerase sigma-70 factor, ECF subfamily